jgi:uroporphyrinogen decarboxylase
MSAWQRIEAAIRAEPTDRPPVALWRHFPEDDQFPDKLVAHTLAWQRRWQFDLVKFMPSGTYGVEDWGAVSAYRGGANGAREVIKPAIAHTDDWLKLRDLDVREGSYGRQNEALRKTAQALDGEVPLLQTVFSPLTTARKLAGERLFDDLRHAPDAVRQALRVITDVTIRFALDALAAGAHGVFFATQLASHRLLSHEEYERFGCAYDLEVLNALRAKSRLSMLHVHGHDIMFDLLAGYPVEMLNWHDRLTQPTLREAASRFPRLLVGGLNENGNLLSGSATAIEAEVYDALAQTRNRQLMIGPGCVVPVAVSDASIAAALRAIDASVDRQSFPH